MNRRRSTRLGAFVALALTFAVPSRGAVAHSPSDEAYVDPLNATLDVNDVLVRAAEHFGGRYAGSWIDPARARFVASTLHVAVVGATMADRAWVTNASGGSSLVAMHNARHSWAELERAAADAIAAAAQSGWRAAAAGIVAARNVVELRVADPAVAVASRSAAVDALVADGRVVVVNDTTLALAAAHAARNKYPPYEAGLEVAVGSNAVCTSGFTVKSGANNYGTTAGHCGPTGSAVKIGGTFISNIGTNGYVDNPVKSDSARFFIPAANATARIDTGVNSHRTVHNTFADAGLVGGTRLCFQGVASDNNNCGNINFSGALLFPDGRTVNPAWCINFAMFPGDSGGPVYQVNADSTARAAGLNAAFATIGGVQSGCFTSIAQAQVRLNVTVLLG